MNLTELSDEHLASQFQVTNDQDAFTELYTRHSRLLQYLAAKAHLRNKAIDFHKFHARYVDKFMAAVKGFDPTRTQTFRKFLSYKIYTADMDVIREQSYTTLYDENGRLIPKPKDTVQPLSTEFYEDGDSFGSVASYSDEYPIEYHEILNQLERDEQIAVLLKDAGYTSIEIAKALGRTGTEAALKMFVNRLFDRIGAKIRTYYGDAGLSFA